MKTRVTFVTLLLAAGACGGEDSILEPGAGNDPGTGTSTLLVNGRVEASPRLTNAVTAIEFDTDFEVDISLNGVEVTAGIVSVTSSSGTFPLAYDGGNGQWQGRANGYDEVYILDVTSGPDEVIGVRVDGPDFHTFVAPLPGATVDSTLPLEVTWKSGQRADSTGIRADNIDWVAVPDTGTYSLSAGALKANSQEATTNELSIRRTNYVVPGGAVPGSEFAVRVENVVEVVAQPNPAL